MIIFKGKKLPFDLFYMEYVILKKNTKNR